jgi:very-short-patch-repair endonuclease
LVGRRRFDDAYPDHRLAIEWDGRRKYHGQFAAFEADRLRDREALLNGWRVVRFTWNDVNNRPQDGRRHGASLLGVHSRR